MPQQERIIAVVFGIVGVAVIMFILFMSVADPLGAGIANFESWEQLMFAEATVGFTMALTFGLVALAFNNERKSPYLLGLSAFTSGFSYALLVWRTILKGYFSKVSVELFWLLLSMEIPLLVSMVVLAKINLKKP
jgi:hypothetical protein